MHLDPQEFSEPRHTHTHTELISKSNFLCKPALCLHICLFWKPGGCRQLNVNPMWIHITLELKTLSSLSITHWTIMISCCLIYKHHCKQLLKSFIPSFILTKALLDPKTALKLKLLFCRNQKSIFFFKSAFFVPSHTKWDKSENKTCLFFKMLPGTTLRKTPCWRNGLTCFF